MYIERQRVDQLPRDAILVSEDEVLKHYQEKIRNWRNFSETWPFNWSIAVLGLPICLGVSSISSYFRNRFKLGNLVKVAVVATSGGVASFASGVVNNTFVLPEILLQKDCRRCTYLKAVGYQSLFFFSYGCICAPAILISLALQHGTYPVPGLSNMAEIKGTAQLYLKTMKRIAPRIIFFTICNVSAAVYVTYKQYSAFEVINKKLYEREREMRMKFQQLGQSVNSANNHNVSNSVNVSNS